jgi:peptidylprolyl isomerase
MSSSSRGRATRIAAALLAVGLLGGLVLQACGSDSSSSSTDTTSADGSTTTTVVKTTSLDGVTVEGALDEKPTISFDPSYAGEADAFAVVAEGDGPVVTADQRVSLDYVATSGADGSELGSTYETEPDKLFMDDATLRPIITEAIVGQKVGTRVVIAIDATDPTSGTGEWNVVAFEIQAAETIPMTAEGEAVAPVAGLPAVTIVEDVPTIATPEGAAPTNLVVQPLIKGAGPVVTAGQTLTVHYVGTIWGSGAVFDSSWERGSPVDFVIGDGQLIAGFDEGLVGQTVGSRVMIVIPPDKGYGAEGNSQAGIAGTDTLIFVVDILAAA